MSDQADFDQEWGDSITVDQESSRRSSTGKKFGYLLHLSDVPTRVHFTLPETPYIHPVTKKRFGYRTGKHHFFPWGGKAGKGSYLECAHFYGGQCVACARANPGLYGLAIEADSALAEYNPYIYYAISGLVEEEYHLVEYRKDQGEGTYKQRERCEGKGCTNCQEGWPKVFGNRFYTEISPPQWALSIHDLHTRVQNSRCRCGGSIYIQNFHCAKCQRLIVDVMSYCDSCKSDNIGLDPDTGMAECGNCHNKWSAFYTNHPHILEASRKKITCDCGYQGLPKPQRFCTTEGCTIDPCTIFDCSLVLISTGEKKNKRLIVDSHEVQDLDARLFDPAEQGNDEWAVKIVEANKKPLDLNYLLQAPPTHEQAKVLRCADPFMNAGMGGQFAQYEGNVEPTVE